MGVDATGSLMQDFQQWPRPTLIPIRHLGGCWVWNGDAQLFITGRKLFLPPHVLRCSTFGCSTCHAEPQHNSETHSSDESTYQCTFSKTSRMFRFSIWFFMFAPGIPADMDVPLDADVGIRADGSLSFQANVTAVPLRPARPQRPMRCT